MSIAYARITENNEWNSRINERVSNQYLRWLYAPLIETQFAHNISSKVKEIAMEHAYE